MTEEYVYHVDEEDNEIGKVLRSEMRKNHFRHRGVIILIFNSKKEMLFLFCIYLSNKL